MEIKELKQIIADVSVGLSFTSCNYTVKQKMLMCQAISMAVDIYPIEMVKYLEAGTRGPGLQNKIFRYYIQLLESALPLEFKKGNNRCVIDDIDDPELNVFSGKEEFEQIINNQFKIKNNTSNMYIGGRKSSYVKPYYIGKLVDLIDIDTGTSLLPYVDDYTFSYIKVSGIKPGTKVKVTHLSVPPHYQMGPMNIMNRIIRQIKNSI